MTDHEHSHDHDHSLDHDHEGTFGMALGFGILEDEGDLFLVEAEISPYVDDPAELGVTLVFHPLAGINPVEETEDTEWPAWPLDIDEELTRDGSSPIPEQFQAILRQLRGLPEAKLVEYLRRAREEGEEEE